MEGQKAAVRYSIVIPAYNYAQYILDSVCSVLKQVDSEAALEVIVVNDGSTDQTGEVLDTLARSEPRLKVVHQKNQGPSAARNAGAELARGEYLWFLDADDRLAEGAVGVFDHAVKAFPDADMIFGGYQPFDDQGKRKPKVPVRGRRNSRKIFEEAIYAKLKGLCIGSSVIRRSFFQGAGFPEGIHNGEDTVMYSLAIARGVVFSIDNIIVYTRRHNASLRGSLEKNIQSGYDTADKLFGSELLPREYQKYKNRFLSYRYLEMSRLYFLNGFFDESVKSYLRGLAVYPGHFFWASYFRKSLKSVWMLFLVRSGLR